MTVFFNFFSGPSTGKSTCATYAFAMSKDDGYNSEYVPEKAKDLAWEKKDITLITQFDLFRRQTIRESRLFHEASVVFADSPVWLSAYYPSLQKRPDVQSVFESMVLDYYKNNTKEPLKNTRL
jgi:hypothetical protein